MFFHLFFPLASNSYFIALFFSFIVSFCSSFYLFPLFIKKFLEIKKNGQPIRENGPKNHIKYKKCIPTMGGCVIVICTLISAMLFSNLKNYNIWLIIFTLISFAILGIIDDIIKLKYSNSQGLNIKIKFIAQLSISLFIILFSRYLYQDTFSKTHFFYGKLIDLKLLCIPFFVLVIVSYSNAVNLTDGLDGLVTFPLIVAIMSLVAIIISSYDINESINILLICSALLGSLLSFLWFNAAPAKLFMGDVGSLSLGAAIGFMSILTKYEMIFALICGLFIIEVLSVIMQVLYFKITKGKKLFYMSPIHHHFEYMGWKEYNIVTRFWIISMVFAFFFLTIHFYLLNK